jgi:hypothetical protein
MMSAERSDRLRRFDDVFRTLLVIASIFVSGALAFYKELLSSDILSVLMFLFVLSICGWAVGTLWGGVEEISLKIGAWWCLMVAFVFSLSRLMFYTTLSVPKFVLTTDAVISFLLWYPITTYFRDMLSRRDLKLLRILLTIITAAFVTADVIFS